MQAYIRACIHTHIHTKDKITFPRSCKSTQGEVEPLSRQSKGLNSTNKRYYFEVFTAAVKALLQVKKQNIKAIHKILQFNSE